MSSVPVKAIYEQLQMLSEKDKSAPPPFSKEEYNALPEYKSNQPIPPPFSAEEYNALPEYKSDKSIPAPFSPEEYKNLPPVQPKMDEQPGGGLIEDSPLQRFFGEGAEAKPLTQPSIPSDYYERAADAESPRGNRAVPNKKSGAFGKYQFTETTWNDLVNSPEGRSAGLKKEARTWADPVQQEKAMRIFTLQNSRRLSASGVPVNNESLYFAHHFGGGSAQKFGKEIFLKEPWAPVPKGLMTKDVLAQNPQLFGIKTVGALRVYLHNALHRYDEKPAKKVVNVMSNTSHQDSSFQNELNPNPEIAVEPMPSARPASNPEMAGAPMEAIARGGNLRKYINEALVLSDSLHKTGKDKMEFIQHYINAAEEKEKKGK